MKKKTFTSLTLLMFLSIGLNAQDHPKPGELIITEFMANPAAVSDTKGEWIELWNASDRTLSLDKLVICDLGSNSHTINAAELIVEPNEFLVLGRNADQSENGGFIPDYKYANFSLGNTEDEIIVKDSTGLIIDQVHYNDSWIIESGQSLELLSNHYHFERNDAAENWNLCELPYGMGDTGTPGTMGVGTFSKAEDYRTKQYKIYPNPATDIVFLELAHQWLEKQVTVQLVSILGQSTILYRSFLPLGGKIELDVHNYPRGIYWIQIFAEDLQSTSKLLLN